MWGCGLRPHPHIYQFPSRGRPFFSGVREVKTSPTTEVGLGRPTFRSGSADWHYLLGLICWLSGFSAQDYLAVLGIDHDGI